MSLLDDEDEDWKRLGKAMQGTSLGDRVDTANGQPNATASSSAEDKSQQKDTPEAGGADRELTSPQGSITFAPGSPGSTTTLSGNEGDTQAPGLSRRKSSMTTIGYETKA